MKPAPEAPEKYMTFDWPDRQRSSWLLAGLIFLSLILHVAAAFLFRSPPASEIPMPRTAAAVGLLTPYDREGNPSSENIILLNWIAAQDPSLSARTPSIMPEGLLEISYKPSFTTPRTPPHGAPVERATVQFPSPKSPIELIAGVTPAAAAPDVSQPRLENAIRFSSTLAGIAPPSPDIPEFKSDAPLEPTRLLIGVGEKGEVRFVFPQSSSGSAAADLAATTLVERLKFNAPKAQLTWGIAEVCWNNTRAPKTQ